MIIFESITLKIRDQLLLKETGLQVSGGDKVVIRGPSGSGKSSLLKCLIGALPMSGGSVRVDGVELSAGTVSDIRSRIAFIGQEPVLGAEIVRKALLLPFSYKVHQGTQPDEERIFQTLELLRLDRSILDKEAKQISGGEKQRIAVARALLLNKTIFIADEITSALDPDSKQAVMDELFQPEFTVLSVSHDADWIGTCSREVEIADHKLMETAQ